MHATDGQLALEGGTIKYQRAGAGRPLTFVHGHTLDMDMWQPQFEAFEPEFEVLRYDMRGYGGSSLPVDDNYLHSTDLLRLHEDLGLTSTSLVGLSLGGQVALEYAIHYPDQIEKLILIDPFLADFSFSDTWNNTLISMIETSMAGDYGTTRKIWWESGLFTPAQEKPCSADKIKSIFNRYSGWHFEHPLHLGVAPVSERLKEIKAPTLILVGDEDIQDFLNISEFLESEIPNASRRVVSGAGHMANLEAPRAVNEAIWDFIG